ncbi:ribosome modulation factor [Pseudorhodoferax soli]|uniref:ribosome modulation factor n=1 Tax=Pseudorhodoferax soli TaxID=545864 RepID=UPI003CCC653A
MAMEVDKAFEQGYFASVAGRPRSANAYRQNGCQLEQMQAMAWTLGWLRGAQDAAGVRRQCRNARVSRSAS